MFLKNWYNCGIRTLADILDNKGNFLSPDDLRVKYNLITTNFLKYLSLRQAVPYKWKCMLKILENVKVNLYDAPMLCIGNKLCNLKYLRTNDLYWEFVGTKCNEPLSCISYWSRLCEINQGELNSYYQIPFMYVKECKVQSMQYKIIHNFYPF